MNPNNEKHMERLERCREWSEKRIEKFRERRKDFVTAYMGQHYEDEDVTARTPINGIAQFKNNMSRYLMGGDPRVLVTARKMENRHYAHTYSVMMASLLERIRFAETIRSCINDSFDTLAIAKVGMTEPSKKNPRAKHPGEPFVDRIDLDDWGHDMAATSLEGIAYCWDERWEAVDDVRENKRYDKSVRESLQVDDRQHEEGTGDRVEDIGNKDGQPELLNDEIRIRDYWIPRDRRVITVAKQKPTKPLEVIDWTGPDRGPYHFLSYFSIPNKSMPWPLIGGIIDLHTIRNDLFKRAIDGALGEKDVVGVGPEAKDDARRILDSPNYSWVPVERPDLIKRIQVGGLNQSALAGYLQSSEAWNEATGNMNAWGGLATSSETVGQDKLITETASQFIYHLQQRVTEFIRDIVRDLTWYLWYHQNQPIPVLKGDLKGLYDIISVEPDYRVGGYFDYLYDISPYSMQYRTPRQVVQSVMQWLTQVIIPAAPIFAQSGYTIDGGELLSLIEENDNLPQLRPILSKVDPAMLAQDQGAPQKPATTNRTYTRVNKPGRTKSAANYALTQALMGKGVQRPEMEAAAR